MRLRSLSFVLQSYRGRKQRYRVERTSNQTKLDTRPPSSSQLPLVFGCGAEELIDDRGRI